MFSPSAPVQFHIRELVMTVALWLGMALTAAAQSCSSFSISPVSFPASSTQALLSGLPSSSTNGTITASCSGFPRNTSIYVCISLGAGSGGTSGGLRLMTSSGGQTLKYNLYTDSALSTVWSNKNNTPSGTIPTPTPYQTGNNSNTSFTYNGTYYAQISGGQSTAPPASYSSTLQSTDTFGFYITSGTCAAATPSGTLGTTVAVSATIDNFCKVSTTALVFPQTGVIVADVSSSGTIMVTCTNTTPYTVALNNGLTGTAPEYRFMTSGSNTIRYGIYTDSGRTLGWSSTNTMGGTGTGNAQSYTAYGKVFAGQSPTPGSYNDTVGITVTY